MSVVVEPGTSLTLTLSRRERGYVASPGPQGAEYLFDRFMEMIGDGEGVAK